MKHRLSESAGTTLFCGTGEIDRVVRDQDVFQVSMTQVPLMYSSMLQLPSGPAGSVQPVRDACMSRQLAGVGLQGDAVS
ncbi:hypothetical protein EON64_13780 [archaeon]|nr:MAG: hypothetical protein EON64_13780 [archaeon]